MATTKVDCPFCAAVLRIPQQSLGKKGRCRTCGQVFVIGSVSPTPEDSASDDDVLGWLAEGAAAQSAPAAQRPVSARATRSEPARTVPVGRQAPSTKDAEPEKKFPVRLGHVDDMGAFFLFDPQVLCDPDFRCSFAQKCIICGGKRHLSIHLVVWSSKLPWRGQFGMRESYAPTVYNLAEMGSPRGPELLAGLQRVADLPEPYCLPFPYYVCHACSAVGAIVTDVRFAPGGTSQECELGISSLERAGEFVLAVRGPGSRALRQVRRVLEATGQDPWRALPLAVRSRIRHWYQQQEGERFVAYIPDADFAKTEAGIAGIVLTDRRLVYRKFAARVEVRLNKEITISRRKSGERTQLEIALPGGKTATLTAGPAATERLRKCLSRQGARARWVV